MEKTKKNKNHDSREPNITETQTNFTTPGHQLKLLTYYKRSFQSNRGEKSIQLRRFLCVPVHMEAKSQRFFLNVAPLFFETKSLWSLPVQLCWSARPRDYGASHYA